MVRDSLARRIIKDANNNRSQVYRWLRENYVEIAKAIQVRGSWYALRKAAIEADVQTRNGTPTIAALRSAWLRVEADMERAGNPAPRSRRGSRPPTRAQKPAETASVQTPARAASGLDEPEQDNAPSPKYTFRPTRLL